MARAENDRLKLQNENQKQRLEVSNSMCMRLSPRHCRSSSYQTDELCAHQVAPCSQAAKADADRWRASAERMQTQTDQACGLVHPICLGGSCCCPGRPAC